MNIRRTRSKALAVAFGGGLVAALLAGCAAPAPAAEPAAETDGASELSTSTGFDERTVERLDEIVRTAIDEAGLPGAVVSISSPERDYLAAAGLADTETGEAMQAGFFHRIGSVTKTFTVTALLRLVDAGVVGLDDPIGQYVPGVMAGERITLRQLAGMQSGLPEYTDEPEFVAAVLADPEASLDPESLIAVISGRPLLFEPGTEVRYTNTNTVLLGLAIEKVTGEPLAEVIRAEVTEPLGLEDTVLPVGNEFPEPHAQGYTAQTLDGELAVATDWNPSWAWAAGAMTSTLADLKVWVPALATGELLSPELQAERLDTAQLWPDEPDAGYGLGLFDNHGWIGHNGSLPGYQTVAVYLPEAETTLIVMVNTDVETEEANPAASLMTPITTLLSPEHVYE